MSKLIVWNHILSPRTWTIISSPRTGKRLQVLCPVLPWCVKFAHVVPFSASDWLILYIIYIINEFEKLRARHIVRLFHYVELEPNFWHVKANEVVVVSDWLAQLIFTDSKCPSRHISLDLEVDKPRSTSISRTFFTRSIRPTLLEMKLGLLAVAIAATNAAVLTRSDATSDCRDLYSSYNLSPNFNETIAHAIHSMTVQGLRMFNPRATEDNTVPTVNHDISDEVYSCITGVEYRRAKGLQPPQK